MNGGRLLAFEGVDGCGKSTQQARLVQALRDAGREVEATAEPSDGAWGRRIRQMARSGRSVSPDEELHWFVEDRREHVREVIRPSLDAGRVVVTDRYFLSSVAYQGAGGLDWRAILADSEAEFPLPDLVLLLEIEPELGLARARGRAGALETVFEEKDRLERVAAIFQQIDRDYVERIPAAGSPDEVAAAVTRRVSSRLGIL